MSNYPTLKAGAVALGLAVLVVGAQRAEAVVMSGGVNLQGVFTSDNTDLMAATSVTISPVSVASATGSFAAELIGAGDPASFAASNPLVFDPIILPGAELYSFGDGADPDGGDGLASRFSFTLLSLFEVPGTTATTLNLFGNGVFKDSTGVYADTYGVWNASFSSALTHANFGFESSSTTTGRVPDGGTSVALFGLALLGMQGVRSLLARK